VDRARSAADHLGPPRGLVVPELRIRMAAGRWPVTRRMFRYEVPLDDQPHAFEVLTVRHVAARWLNDDGLQRPVVEFWAEYNDTSVATDRHFQVFGTGHELPPDARWVGTCDRDVKGLVWHLYERWPT
jgi:hypothetical protein